MDFISTHTALTDVLHALAQALLAPDIILLLAFAGYAIFCIGSVLTEFFTERRNFKVAMPKFLAALMAAEEEDIPQVIADSGLLNRQKIALLTVYDYRTLPGDAMVALIRRIVNQEETRYDRITGRNNTAAKISPMLGLMGTLIPLGPGIAALGQGNTAVLSSSLLIAFDTTVAGLIVAAICLAVGKIRSNWYNDYLSALDSGMATMLQKIEDMRAEGKITAIEPTDYAFMFEESLAKDKGKNAKTENAEAVASIADEVAAEAGVGLEAATEPAEAPEAAEAVEGAAATDVAEAAEVAEAAAEDAVEAQPVPEITTGEAVEAVVSKTVETVEFAQDQTQAAQIVETAEPAAALNLADTLPAIEVESPVEVARNEDAAE